MKKKYFALLLSSLFIVKGIAQQVEEQQRSLVTKRTADWCPFCGTWGWSFFQNAIDQNGDKAVFMAAHYDGNLSILAADEITDNFGGVSQPRFYLNADDQGVTSGNGSNKLADLKAQIDDAFLQAPVANVGFEPIYDNGEIKVNAKVKFFQAAQGEYWLGLYLLQDNVVANQASIGPNAVHKRLLRQSFTSESFGKFIINGDIADNQEFELDFSLPFSDPTGGDFEVIGIIWKKEAGKYFPLNVWGNKDIQIASSTTVVSTDQGLLVSPTVSSDFFLVTPVLQHSNSSITIDLLDMNGSLVHQIFRGTRRNEDGPIWFSTKGLVSNGLYFVRLSSATKTLTEKIIVQD